MKKDELNDFLIEAIKKQQKIKGKYNPIVDKNVDEVIHSLKKLIKINGGIKIK
jgi:hypothetical protein|tara:strand:- start:265 stop:423 length:159 start_codon:yes stop_codon:yes gene_type:complete